MRVLYYSDNIDNLSGYGIAAIGDITVIQNLKDNKHIEDIIHIQRENNIPVKDIFDISILKVSPHNISPRLIDKIRKISKKIYCTFVWETDPIPPRMQQLFQHIDIDGYLCPSLFCVRLLDGLKGKDIKYFPHYVDIPEYVREPNPDLFQVLFMGQHTIRKGIGDAIVAFTRSIGQKPDTRLIVKYNELSKTEIDINRYSRYLTVSNAEYPAQVYLTNDRLDKEGINALYNTSQVLLFPTRGEGFGLPIAEMMATGGRVIYTDWSASSEVGVSLLNRPIEYTLDEAVGMIQYGYTYGTSYAIPKISDIMESLTVLYEEWKQNPVLYTKTAKANIDYIRDKYSIEVVAANCKKVLEEICQKT